MLNHHTHSALCSLPLAFSLSTCLSSIAPLQVVTLSHTPKVISVVKSQLIASCFQEIDSDFLPIFLTISPPSPALTPLSFLFQGMVYSAEYIKKKLEQEMILSQAFGRDLVHDSVYIFCHFHHKFAQLYFSQGRTCCAASTLVYTKLCTVCSDYSILTVVSEVGLLGLNDSDCLSQNKGTMHYGLVIVGHSLGAGTAAILSFLLRPQYPTLHCYSYSPPGGLLR